MQHETDQEYEISSQNNYQTRLAKETLDGEVLTNTCECPKFGRDKECDCNHLVRNVSTFALKNFGMIIGLNCWENHKDKICAMNSDVLESLNEAREALKLEKENIKKQELLSTHKFQVKDKINLTLSFYKEITFLGTVFDKRGRSTQGFITIVFLKDAEQNIYTCSWDIFHKISDYVSSKYERSSEICESEFIKQAFDDFRENLFTLNIDAKVLSNSEYKDVKQTKIGYIKNLKVGE